MWETLVTFFRDWQIWLYWLPLIGAATIYFFRTVIEIRRDLANKREVFDTTSERTHYYPTVTVGTIVGRILLTVIPVVNLVVFVFDCAPALTKRFFSTISEILDMPIVKPIRKVR